MLSLIIFLPLVGGIIILFTSKTNETLLKGIALGASLASFVLSLFMTALFKIGGGFQFLELGHLIPSLGIHSHLGVDGLSLRLIVLQPLAANPALAALAFWGFFLSFAIKVPMSPFHTWLPDAHVEAPTAGSVILAGVLLKMGTYGFVRVSLPMLPEAFRIYAPAVAVLALLGIVYGALVAMAQTDLKKLVAYSSVNHMGYVMLGVASAAAAAGIPEKAVAAATALNGAVFEMVAHGVITGALFLIVGVLYDFRAHTRGVDEFGGLGARLPMYTGITMVAMLASLGLPGLMGFVAEFFIFVGSFGIFPYLTVVAVTGVIFTAAMFLWTIQRIFLGPFNERWAGLPDMDTREKISLMPLAVLMVIFGLYPRPLLDVINAAMTTLVGMVR